MNDGNVYKKEKIREISYLLAAQAEVRCSKLELNYLLSVYIMKYKQYASVLHAARWIHSLT